MSIKEIKEKLLQDALEEKQKIIKNVKTEIDQIKNQAKRENDLLQKEILDRYQQEADLKEKKIITEAILNAKKTILAAKQQIINNVFSEAINRIMKFDEKKYLSFMEKLILNNVETGNEIVFLGNNERQSINEEFITKINRTLLSQGKKGELKISKERLPIMGGVVLGMGEIRKNSSLEIILEKVKDEMETKLNQFLFTKNKA